MKNVSLDHRRILRFLRRQVPLFIGAALMFAAIASLTFALFLRSGKALEQQLRETLRAAAISAAYSIDGDELATIHGPDDMDLPAYKEVSSLLRNLVNDIPQVRFAYILRRTESPDVLEFVVDADTTKTSEELDRNRNGTVDLDEEPSFPGEQYDISDVPALQYEAFLHSTTDWDVTVDQWGELMSGYAPIRSRSTGKIVAVLGIDMDASEFRANTRSVLSPYTTLLIVLLAGMLVAGVALLIESRQLQSISRMNAERSGLLQLTFHQLGEPITIIQWAIESLEDMKDDTAALQKVLPENLTDMHEGVRRLSSIIDTLQEAEKVELGVFENKPVEQSVKRVIADVVAIVAPPSVNGASRVDIVADDTVSAFDPHLLTVALRRIIENALEFSKSDTVVRIVAHRDEKRLRIDVVDQGCGIPLADIPKLFEKYHRASNAHVMKPDGNGLGLYIAKGVVELMGGTIDIHSREGQGTTVSITLPVRPVRGS